MARLKFDLQPVVSEWRTGPHQAEHDENIRAYFARHHPDDTPGPCDCGYWADNGLVYCRTVDRPQCKRDVAKRLEHHYREAHKKALRQKREFPGAPHIKSAGCNWCGKPIVHGRAAQRSWHDGRLDEPDCLFEYYLRTRSETQQRYLVKRDGMRCRCGKVCGRWHIGFTFTDEGAVRRFWDRSAWFKRTFPTCPGWITYISWSSTFEVDHILPLAAAWVAFPEDDRRRWFFGPRNLAGLCRDCHRKKTKDDIAFIRALQQMPQEAATMAVLDKMRDLGLLKGQRE